MHNHRPLTVITCNSNYTLREYKSEYANQFMKQVSLQNLAILDRFFELESLQFLRDFKPLDQHLITDDYRTKMVDWMIEVCTSFSCSDRTWFLAVQIFDRYLNSMKGKRVLKNPDVHALGIVAMYLAAKYEDVYPFSSFIAFERISHKAVTQKDILRLEGDFLRAFEFDLELVTPFDFHQYVTGILSANANLPQEHRGLLKNVEELSLMILRMAFENHSEFFKDYKYSLLTCSAISSAVNLLKTHRHIPANLHSFF